MFATSAYVYKSANAKCVCIIDAEKPLWQWCGSIAQPSATTRLLMDIADNLSNDKATEQLIQQSIEEIQATAVDYHTVGYDM